VIINQKNPDVKPFIVRLNKEPWLNLMFSALPLRIDKPSPLRLRFCAGRTGELAVRGKPDIGVEEEGHE
jgi:hypothetical protein